MTRRSYKHIYLTGCMGCGKTTVAKLAARKLGRRLVDLDQLIEEQEGKSINEIFDEVGEEGFREIETRVLKSLPEKQRLFVATGGGIVIKKENRDWMKEHGAVIWLDIPAEVLARRLRGEKNRPLLAGENMEDKLNRILAERREMYADCTYRLDAEDLTPLQVVLEISKFTK